MSVVSVRARSFILALFIRDDGERFLLGDRGFDFKDSQLHFSANTIENDEVEKQGVDGVMLAGQVRRASVQSFDGYVGDGSTLKEEVEQMRRDFIAFFAKGHHFRVIYIDCNRNAWQRKGGYLVDAPEVKELWQIHPEYHVGLNFEDVNYYEYDENAEGEEILSNIISVPISSDVEGGLVWDENGAVSEPEEIEYDTETATASGTNISIADAVNAPLASFQLDGETSQQTYTGKNLIDTYSFVGKQAAGTLTVSADGVLTLTGNTNSNGWCAINGSKTTLKDLAPSLVAGNTYYLYLQGSNLARTNIYLNGSATGWTQGTAHTITQAELDGFIVIYGGYNTTTTFKIMITAASDNVYEQYVGGTSSPNPSYPQSVKTVTGENTVKIHGKNLFKIIPGSLGTRNGVTASYDETTGVVTLNGTCTTDNTSFTVTPNTEIWGLYGTFTLSYEVVGGSISNATNNTKIQIQKPDYSGSLYLKFSGSSASSTYTVSADYTYKNIRIDKDVVLNNYQIRIQLEKSNQATDWEPYQEQSYEVNLGKNLYDKDSADYNVYLGSESVAVNAQGNGWSIAIPVEVGQTYTFSRQFTTGQASDANYAFIGSAPAAGVAYIGGRQSLGTRTTFTATAPAGAKYLIIYYTWNATATQKADAKATFQLEKGSTATSYAPYFTPIELCKIGDYQDYIYKSGDKWYRHKELGSYVATGDEDISILSKDTNKIIYIPNNEALQGNSNTLLSTHFIYEWANNIGACYVSGTNHVIACCVDGVTTVADAKTWLASNKPKFVYILATPTDTEITNEALVAQLEAILDGGTSAGTNNITTIISAGNAQGELEITYYTKYDAKVVGGYVWGAGGSGGPTIVTNESISVVSPVWTVFGPALNPMLENTTTGEQIQYVDMISEGQTLVVDMGEQTASLDGLNVISNIVGEYLTLAPGSNTLLFSADSDAPASEIGWSEIVG